MKRIDAAIAVIRRGGRILICQRKEEDTFGGYWEFPGGKAEHGETLADCLARELREEIDVVAPAVEKLTPIQHDYPHVRLTLHPFLCDHISGEPKLIECQRVEWVLPAELPSYRFPPANESLLAEIIARLTAEPERTRSSDIPQPGNDVPATANAPSRITPSDVP